jgi:putative SOS response-associated peptidase YedK
VEKDGERDSGDVQCAGGSIADKPMFHNAFKERRCVIPASRFFE